jgi:predicted nuclease of predicted toxin-antitoxin system
MSTDPLFIRLYLDEDFHPDIAAALRQHSHDCQSALEARMLGKSDEEQLKHATAQGRCLLSFNVADFVILAQQWVMAGKAHAGIIVTQQVSRRHLGNLLQRILRLLNATAADEILNVVRYLP